MSNINKGYLGIDESNHGKPYEVFVGVYSQKEKDLLEQKHLDKKTGNGRVSTALGTRQFRHILITQDYKISFSDHQIKVIALVELIRFFGNENRFGKLEQVIFDGELRSSEQNLIQKILSEEYYMPTPPLLVKIKADEKIPLVNKADRVARLLYRYYSQKGKEYKKYQEHLLIPNIHTYLKLI